MFEDLTPRSLELRQHFVRRGLAHQDEERRAAGIHGGCQLFINLSLMPTSVRRRKPRRPRPYRRPSSGFRKIRADQRPQKPPPTAPAAVSDRLVQLDLALAS